MGYVDRAITLILRDRPGGVTEIPFDDAELHGDQPRQRRRINVMSHQATPVVDLAAIVG